MVGKENGRRCYEDGGAAFVLLRAALLSYEDGYSGALWVLLRQWDVAENFFFFKISEPQNNVVLSKINKLKKQVIEPPVYRNRRFSWFAPIRTGSLRFKGISDRTSEPGQVPDRFPVQPVRPAGPVFTTLLLCLAFAN